MINNLKGIIIGQSNQNIVINVNDIGFSVAVPSETKFKLEEPTQLFIHFHWNQENGPSLFGFETEQERSVFQLIINCSGIGPKIGLAVLNHMSASAFLSAVATQDTKALSSVSGIGTKKAENIIVQLKDKVEKLLLKNPEITQDNSTARHMTEMVQVLTTLNYSRAEINAALDYVKSQNNVTELPFDGLLRKALSFLSKRL